MQQLHSKPTSNVTENGKNNSEHSGAGNTDENLKTRQVCHQHAATRTYRLGGSGAEQSWETVGEEAQSRKHKTPTPTLRAHRRHTERNVHIKGGSKKT